MSVTPSGSISLPLENLAVLLAACPAFQAWVNAPNAQRARNSIYLVARPAGSAVRPFALIHQTGAARSWAATRIADGAAGMYTKAGALGIFFEAGVSPEYQPDEREADAELEFTNAVGAIIDGLLDLAGTAGYIAIRDVRKAVGPVRASSIEENTIDAAQPDSMQEQSNGCYYQIAFEITWWGI